jgi:CheY-like chemotaxis protein
MILLAEDSQDDAEAVRAILRRAGVMNAIQTVTDGDQTVSYIEGEGKYADRERFPFPRVLLLDLVMPRFDGLQVLEWLKVHPQREQVLVIVLTGHHDMNRMHLAYALGAKSFLTKPCQIEDIQNLMRAYPLYWSTRSVQECRLQKPAGDNSATV